MTTLSHRKKRKREPSNNDKCQTIDQFKDTMGKRRRTRVRKRLNLRKRHPISKQEEDRKTKKHCIFLPLAKEHWDDILSGDKKFEFRRKNSKVHVKQIGENHHLLMYIIFWLRQRGPPQLMIVEFNGLDEKHERSSTDYCMRLGKIVSRDLDTIHKIGYNWW